MEELPDIDQEEQQDMKEEDIDAMLHYFASQLPARMQQIFLMSRSQGHSYKEIAEKLDISVKTVENTMGAALKKMRTLLYKHKYLSMLSILIE